MFEFNDSDCLLIGNFFSSKALSFDYTFSSKVLHCFSQIGLPLMVCSYPEEED